MSQALTTTNPNTAFQLPSYLQGRADTGLQNASAQINDMDPLPVVKLDKGLWLTKGPEKLARKTARVVQANGDVERIPDIMDFVILGHSEVTYAMFPPGQVMGGKPMCYSVGGNVPHAHAPQPQSIACKTCRWNQDGSGQNGRGKACGKRRVAFGFDFNDPERTLVGLQIPTLSNWFSPKAAPGWYGYKDLILEFQRNSVAPQYFVVRVHGTEEDNKPRLNFAVVGYLPEDLVSVVEDKALISKIGDMRRYYEYDLTAPVPTAPTNGHLNPTGNPVVQVDAATMTVLSGLLANPATRAQAESMMAAMGIAAPATEDPLKAYREAFPGVPDNVLESMRQHGVPPVGNHVVQQAVNPPPPVVTQTTVVPPVTTQAAVAPPAEVVAPPVPAPAVPAPAVPAPTFQVPPPVEPTTPVEQAAAAAAALPAVGEGEDPVAALQAFIDSGLA